MVILGVVLIALGAVVIVAAVFDLQGSAALLSIDLSAVTVFLLGVAAGVAVLWGFGILRFGTKRSLQRRRESKKLEELSQKLDRVEAERKHDERDENP
ncbi:hypothetical protein [Nocardioides sp.]|uniref:hypothetical protein n=1 Tax=Nocardioides sp. TaxID=35761 RepID=UPI002ED4B226